MPRRPRMYLPGIPYHIVQRGNNREACFYSPDDYLHYLSLLEEVLLRYRVVLHSYVLMTNHVHLLMTPEDIEGISNVMKVLGSRYAQYANRTYNRTGTMWEGRHKSSAVNEERYLLTCYRYIEMNPVNAKMVETPDQYQWSSYPSNALGEDNNLITPHDVYLGLAADTERRCSYYRGLFSEALTDEDLNDIRIASHYGQAFGSDQFKAELAKNTGQKIGQLHRGRPKK